MITDCDSIADLIAAYRLESGANPPKPDDLRNAVLPVEPQALYICIVGKSYDV
jgi:hypothetical protein